MTPAGTVTTLHSFSSTDGAFPYGSPLQATDGNFYGTTFIGGANGDGTVYSLSMGLGPLVKTMPHFGKARAAIEILGTNLTVTTSVAFNGCAAAFTVVSATESSTAVPVGATTGQVQ